MLLVSNSMADLLVLDSQSGVLPLGKTSALALSISNSLQCFCVVAEPHETDFPLPCLCVCWCCPGSDLVFEAI